MPTLGLRRGTILCVSGGGYRAAIFHLGALTRLNELGLLAGTETICAVAGGSILGALLATRVPWALQGAFREWPEQVAEPMREIASRRARRSLLGPIAGAGDAAAREERYARELVGWSEGEAPERPRFVFGAAGLELGQMASREGEGREPEVSWELPMGLAAIAADLAPLGEAERAALENEGYRLADAALRRAERPVAALEPLPPQSPHPPRAGRPQRRGARLRLRRGRGRSAPRASALLDRYRPLLQHDSLESYRPISVAAIAELAIGSRCNTLHRANGELLASVLPLEGAARLDLAYLDGPTYADGRAAREDDFLDEAGGSHDEDALALRRRDGRREVVYGHAAWSGGRLWLQYWLFYYYNDKGFLTAGRHEGDWEIVQLRIGDDDRPDAVTFGQHGGGERASWEEVERQRVGEEEVPVVYCARGSHALLPRPGTRLAPAVPDHNDGLGPRSRPRLIEIGEELPGWARWPGRWGSTRRREAFEGDSPRGPAQHREWRDPAGFHAEARPAGEAAGWGAPPPPTPRFEARLESGHAVLSYRFGERLGKLAPPARILAATAAGSGEVGSVVHCFGVDGRGGACALPAPPDSPLRGVRAGVASALGTPGPAVTVPLA